MKVFFLFGLLLVATSAMAQRQSGIRFFSVNPYLINPANAGYVDDFHSYFACELPSGPVKKNSAKYLGTFQYTMKKSMLGVGGKIQHYKRGVFETTSFDIALAYKIRLTKDLVASFGMDGGLRNNSLKQDELNDQVDLTDNTIYSDYNSGLNLKAGLGISLISYKFEAGLSLPEIFESRESTDFNSVLYAMYTFELNGRNFMLKPIAYVNYFYHDLVQYEGLVQLIWMESFWLQIGLNNSMWASSAIGYRFPQMEVAYGFEYNLHPETTYLGPYHNIMVAFNLKGKRGLAFVRPLRFRGR